MKQSSLVVLDSSVFIKLFVEESDRMDAVELIEYINQNDIKIIAPELFITETLNVCMTKGVMYQNIIDIWELQCSL